VTKARQTCSVQGAAQKNADNSKTHKDYYMLIRLLYEHRMTKYVGTIFALKFQVTVKKTATNLGDTFCHNL